MSGKPEMSHIQSHTEYVRSRRTCPGCGTGVPVESSRAAVSLCENCRPNPA